MQINVQALPTTIPRSYRALTLTQPWATLVAIGAKEYETRSYPLSEKFIGIDLAIHAGKRFADMTVEYFCHLCASDPFKTALVDGFQRGVLKGVKDPDHLYPGDLPRGAVVAIVRLAAIYPTDCLPDVLSKQERAFGNFRPGRYAWKLENVRVLQKPIPARGMQGIWNWTPNIPLEFLPQHGR